MLHEIALLNIIRIPRSDPNFRSSDPETFGHILLPSFLQVRKTWIQDSHLLEKTFVIESYPPTN
jgi:hypothetical protein